MVDSVTDGEWLMIEPLSTCGRCHRMIASSKPWNWLEPKVCRGCRIKEMPDSQRKVFMAVRRHGPSGVPEIARHVPLAKSTIHHHLVRLRAKGMVEWETGKQNTIHEKRAA